MPFTEQGSHLAVLHAVSATRERRREVLAGARGRGERRRAQAEGQRASDGQPEGADDAVHGLVLPPHGAAACGEKARSSARGAGGAPPRPLTPPHGPRTEKAAQPGLSARCQRGTLVGMHPKTGNIQVRAPENPAWKTPGLSGVEEAPHGLGKAQDKHSRSKGETIPSVELSQKQELAVCSPAPFFCIITQVTAMETNVCQRNLLGNTPFSPPTLSIRTWIPW